MRVDRKTAFFISTAIAGAALGSIKATTEGQSTESTGGSGGGPDLDPSRMNSDRVPLEAPCELQGFYDITPIDSSEPSRVFTLALGFDGKPITPGSGAVYAEPIGRAVQGGKLVYEDIPQGLDPDEDLAFCTYQIPGMVVRGSQEGTYADARFQTGEGNPPDPDAVVAQLNIEVDGTRLEPILTRIEPGSDEEVVHMLGLLGVESQEVAEIRFNNANFNFRNRAFFITDQQGANFWRGFDTTLLLEEQISTEIDPTRMRDFFGIQEWLTLREDSNVRDRPTAGVDSRVVLTLEEGQTVRLPNGFQTLEGEDGEGGFDWLPVNIEGYEETLYLADRGTNFGQIEVRISPDALVPQEVEEVAMAPEMAALLATVPTEFRAVLVEEHEGSVYAIDDWGAAVAVQNENGWERYTRPAVVVRSSNRVDIPVDVRDELAKNNITRLVDNEGNLVPFGYLFEWQPYEDNENLRHIFVSGYSRGAFEQSFPNWTNYWMFLEIPNRYDRQVMAVLLSDQMDVMPNVWSVPPSGNVEASGINLNILSGGTLFVGRERERVISNEGRGGMVYNDLALTLARSEAVGKQIVIAIQIPPYPWTDDEIANNASPDFRQKALEMNENASRLGAALREGAVIQPGSTLVCPTFFWIPESLTR